jgi:hypothetical protein
LGDTRTSLPAGILTALARYEPTRPMVLPMMLLPTNDLFPGWHTDPQTPAAERFWDGRSWTDKTRPAPRPHAAEDLTIIVDRPSPEPIREPVREPISGPIREPIAEPVSIFVARDRSDADLFQVARRVQLPPAGTKHPGAKHPGAKHPSIARRSAPGRPILVGVAALLIGAIGGFLVGYQVASNDVEVPAVSQAGATAD